MIELTARHGASPNRRIKILGIGGAGANALDRLVLDGVNPCHLIAGNTDSLALNGCVAGEKLHLGRLATRGLGCGGDPELGRSSAGEGIREIHAALDDLDCVFLLAGLGGGTGSGAAPVFAEAAHEAGALVIAVVTLPFAFEGKRRMQQAMEALEAIQTHADAVVCFENDRMADLVSPKAGIQDAFAASDHTISQSVQAIVALLSRQGLVHLGFDDFRAALRPVGGLSPRCLFGFGEASGDNRPYDALSKALRNPLMDRGRLLRECDSVLVQVSGGADLTLNEVQLLMEELNRHVDEQTRILFGVAVAPELAGRLTVTVVSALGAGELAAAQTERDEADSQLDAVSPQGSPLREIVEREVKRGTIPPSAEPVAAPFIDDRMPVMEPAEGEPGESEPDPESWETGEAPVSRLDDEPESVEANPELPVEDALVAAEPQTAADEAREDAEAVTGQPEIPAQPQPPLDTVQPALFRDDSQPSQETKPAAEPPSTKIQRPVPGRTLQPGAARMPMRRTEPVAESRPETKAAAPAAPSAPASASALPSFLIAPPSAPRPAKPAAAKPAPAEPAAPPASGPKLPQQETLQFEPVSRGRFDKSEPTIVDGQDLDVPTFLRRNVRVR